MLVAPLAVARSYAFLMMSVSEASWSWWLRLDLIRKNNVPIFCRVSLDTLGGGELLRH